MGQVGQGDSESFLRYKSFHFFVSDNWKITSKLSFNLGIRWEYEQRYHDRDSLLSVFDERVGRVVYSQDGEIRNGIFDPDWNNVAPRIDWHTGHSGTRPSSAQRTGFSTIPSSTTTFSS